MDPESWQKLKDLVYDALQQPASGREAYVRARLGGSPDADLAVAMLRDYEGDGQHLLPSLQSDHIIPLPVAAVDELDDIQPGTRIGPYVVIERIDRGGQGQVFLARDQDLERRVALKCLLRSHQGSSIAERSRILHEARAAAAVDHTNVARVYHVVEQEARAFIVMEYVEGETLAARLKRVRMPVEDVVAIGRQLCAALAAAHAEGVVHGDLKPANVKIMRDGTAKVLDFGVARALQSMSSASSQATTHGGHVVGMIDAGTPPYMSPEQLLGRSSDERSDLYSLGVVLFEMATGRRPYAGTDPADLVREHAKGAPRADAVARVPRALSEVIARGLDRDLAQRYQSALELGAALEALGIGRPRREPIRVWSARVLTGAVLLVLAATLVGGLRIWGFNNTFGRTGSFARFGAEPLWLYPSWALPGTVGKLTVATLLTLTAMVVRGVARLVAGLLPGAAARGRTVVRSLIPAGTSAPAALAQVLAGLGIAAIVGVWWDHRAFINAWMVSFNSAPLEMFDPIRESTFERFTYHMHLTVAILALAYGLYKVVDLQRRERDPDGRVALITLAGVIAVLVVMNEAPYKAINDRDFERVDYAGERCYITGESGPEVLVLCPNAEPPRNRAVRLDDPKLHRPGAIENVFRGINPRRSAH